MDEAAKNNESPAWQTDEFRIYEYKVKRCSRSRPHDWTCCPFAHNGEKAKRRDPRRFAYTGAACPDYRKNASCRRGDKCPFAHGVFESWLHPSRYRTQCCTDGAACKRRVCFFAHHESELRKPEDDPALLEAQLQAEALASTEQYQQILAAASLDMVAEAAPSGTPGQLNLALLQALLQSSAGASPAPQQVGWVGESEAGQERVRLLQLQNLLAAIQLRNMPPQPPPQRSPSQSDALGSLDAAALGRLLAANQALVQRQAEQEMLQRSSFEAARRNSISCDSSLDLPMPSPSLRYTASDPFAASSGGTAFVRGQSEATRQAGMRRMSMDNIGSHSQTSASPQGLDPRILAALAMSQRSGPPSQAQALLNAQNRNAAALRRSVDLGSLAHSASFAGGPLSQHASNDDLNRQLSECGLTRQQVQEHVTGGVHSLSDTVGNGGPRELQFAVSQAPAEAYPSAFANAFHQQLESRGSRGQFCMEQQQQQIDPATINALLQSQHSSLQQQAGGGNNFSSVDSQGSEQLRRYAELIGQPPSGQPGGYSGQPGNFSGQPSGQLSTQASGQLGQQLLPGQGSARLGSIGAFLSGQGSGQLGGSFGLTSQTSGHLDMQARQLQQRFNPGGHSLSSAGSMTRIPSEPIYPTAAGMAGGVAAAAPCWPAEGDASFAHAQQQLQQQQGEGVRQQLVSSSSGGSHKPPLSDEEGGRLTSEELYGGHPSGVSTPSQGPPTPCKHMGGLMPNQAAPLPREYGHAGASSASPHSAAYDISTRSSSASIAYCSPPSIPEEGPAWAAAGQLPQLQAAEAGVPSGKRMMPTLLEQLQFFDSQRNASAPLLDVHHPAQMMMARNTSFERLSAELPRSISDLNLAEAQAAAPSQPPPASSAPGRR